MSASNLMAGTYKLVQNYSPFENNFVVKYYTFRLKMFSMTNVGRFLRRFSVVDFSAVDFLDFLKTVRLNTESAVPECV